MTGLKPLRKLSHPQEVIRQFTPNWFTMNMGTGILFLMLAQFPFFVFGLKSLTRILFWADIGFYLLFCGMFIGRWVFFTKEALRLLDHPVQSMFLGGIPMGLAWRRSSIARSISMEASPLPFTRPWFCGSPMPPSLFSSAGWCHSTCSPGSPMPSRT